MSPAVIPPIVPIAIIAKRNRILRRFDKAAAYTPETAQTLESLNLAPSHILHRMIKSGVLKEVPTGRFYIDQSANAAFRRRALQTAAAALLLVAAALAVIRLLTR